MSKRKRDMWKFEIIVLVDGQRFSLLRSASDSQDAEKQINDIFTFAPGRVNGSKHPSMPAQNEQDGSFWSIRYSAVSAAHVRVTKIEQEDIDKAIADVLARE